MAVTLLRRGWWRGVVVSGEVVGRRRRARICGTAEQMLRRADTADQVPEFGVSLDAGRVSGAHVDVLARHVASGRTGCP